MQSLSLAERLAESEETIRQLRALLIPKRALPAEMRLTPYEQSVVLYLMERSPGIMSRQQIAGALYFDKYDGGADPAIIDVFICKARPKLSRFRVFIRSRWGIGYSMPVESAEILRGLVA